MNASRASGSPSFLLRAGAFALAGLLLAGCGGDKPAEGGGGEAAVGKDGKPEQKKPEAKDQEQSTAPAAPVTV